MKTCSKCKIEKSKSEFRKNKSKKMGLIRGVKLAGMLMSKINDVLLVVKKAQRRGKHPDEYQWAAEAIIKP